MEGLPGCISWALVVTIMAMELEGSRAKKDRVRLKGSTQGMFIQGESPGKPVLLFVHGGPGMPEYWLTRRYPFRLHELFTVAWWEQLGSGLSYERGIPREAMTSERFVSDTLAVSNHLRHRSGQARIYLMAHSWGSYIGLQAVAQAPELYHAYIGVAQITHQIESEELAYQFMLQRYRELGKSKMVRRLEAAPVTQATIPLPAPYDAVRDRAMHGLGVGTTRDMRSVVTGLFLPSWRFPEYTLREKVNLWRGKTFSRHSGLWNEMLAADLRTRVPELRLPAYFLHGRHDYTVSYELSKAYARQLVAPLKGFYTFLDSAHSPMFEEPVRTLKILREDVLSSRNHLADRDLTATTTPPSLSASRSGGRWRSSKGEQHGQPAAPRAD
jgi:pimeloyl-ACP methyl ester carboxylesterase